LKNFGGKGNSFGGVKKTLRGRKFCGLKNSDAARIFPKSTAKSLLTLPCKRLEMSALKIRATAERLFAACFLFFKNRKKRNANY
jgi:hypothetical protein